MAEHIREEKYIYRNCPIPGGGYVTGFAFHEKKPGVMYCRTDIGGTYRFNSENMRWESLIKHVTMESPEETFPIAIALDYENPAMLYIACGINNVPNGLFAVSRDYGETFEYHRMPMMIHGNLNGRGTGYRLIVDHNSQDKVYFASQQNGLWTSDDYGKTWTKMEGFPEEYMTFVGKSRDGEIMVAAGAGVTTKRAEHLRGHSLYVSLDDGQSFLPLVGPEDTEIDGVDLAGHIAQRYAFDDKYLYVTYSVMGRNAYVRENGYSCDGGSVIGGRIFRYDLKKIKSGSEDYAQDITPDEYPASTAIVPGLLEYGFSGVDTSASMPGLVVASTISRELDDCVFRSMDYGESWECVLNGLTTGVMDFRTSYMKPEYNGNHNLIHWLSDIKIDPHNENVAWFNTGTGVFRTLNLTADCVHFSDFSDGIEETVHLNLYSPPSGDVKLIDILGDLGGFAFKDLNSPCDNSFADENGNRYITCINADYSDSHPETVVVTPRGNWTGKTKGGLIISEDQCASFRRINLPYGLSETLDAAFHNIETPNVNSGWVALSADANTIVWSVARGIELPSDMVVVSHDKGQTFNIVKIYTKDNEIKASGCIKVFSDRTDSNKFYAFGEHSDMYISTDAGDTFREISAPKDFPEINFGMIDTINKTEVRADSGKSGVFYMALSKAGMWKVSFEDGCVNCEKLNREGDAAYRLGVGIGRDATDYFDCPKVIYFAGTVDGEYGFYRTEDEGKTYVRINDDKQMFGDINSIEGDSRVFGRFFVATGSLGVMYGEPCE